MTNNLTNAEIKAPKILQSNTDAFGEQKLYSSKSLSNGNSIYDFDEDVFLEKINNLMTQIDNIF